MHKGAAMNLYEKMKTGVYVIAEMSANHAGKIENAFKIIEEAAKAGADCVKIQTYTADTLTIDCDDELYRIKGGLWDGYNYYQLYQEAYTPWEWQQQLMEKCEEMGDHEEAERFTLYAESEGKVFRNIDEVERAYLTKQINLHNRIAIPGKEINKDNLTEEEYNGYLITTVGKLIFNKIYPADFPYLNDPSNKKNFEKTIASDFVPKGTNIKEYIANQPIRKPYCKKDLGTIINQIFRNKYFNKLSKRYRFSPKRIIFIEINFCTQIVPNAI